MNYKIQNAYISKLSLKETILAKEEIRSKFKKVLSEKLNLIEVEPSIVTDMSLWLNDDFNSSERPIDFDTKINVFGQVIQSSTKFRRKFLTEMEIKKINSGILTDALYPRRDRELSNVSAISFNEIGFDILRDDKNLDEIKDLLTLCYAELIQIDSDVSKQFKEINRQHLDSNITYVTNFQLKTLYPLLSYYERLNVFGKDNGSFIIYDFVTSLLDTKNESNYSQDIYDFDNYCELYIYNKSIQQSICIGWGSYQVDRDELKKQSLILRDDKKGQTNYNNMIKSEELSRTISISFDFPRIVMTILEKQHIGEVISSIWEPEFLDYAEKNGLKII